MHPDYFPVDLTDEYNDDERADLRAEMIEAGIL